MTTAQMGFEVPGESLPGARKKSIKQLLVEHRFLIALYFAVTIGAIAGIVLQEYASLTNLQKYYVGFPGELLMRMLKMLILPLITSGIITGVASLSKDLSGKVALRAAMYFLMTTLISVTVGVILVALIKPGVSYTIGEEDEDDSQGGISTVDAILDLMRNMIPDNLVEATFLQHKTARKYIEISLDENSSTLGTGPENVTYDIQVVGERMEGINIVGLIIVCMIFGMIIGELGEEGKPLLDFFICLNKVTERLVDIFLCYMPLGMIFLIAGKIAEIDNWYIIEKLGKYVMTVVIGLIIHAFLVLPGIYYSVVKTNPYHYIWGMSPALLTAFSMSSSSATLPLTFQCCEIVNKIDKRITHFMLPMGVTINMDGTALYEAVAALFIAQLHQIHLSAGQVFTIGVAAGASSFGSSGIPAVGAVTTLLVLTSVDLPVKNVTLLIAVEWILDRCCTCVNVLGDAIGVAIVDKLSESELEEMDRALKTSEEEEQPEASESIPQQL